MKIWFYTPKAPAGRRKDFDALDHTSHLDDAARTGSLADDGNGLLLQLILGDTWSDVWNSRMRPPEAETGKFAIISADYSQQTVAASTAVDTVSAPAAPVSSITIDEGGSAEIAGPGTQSVIFTGTTGTLKIDHALAFTGKISGVAGADALDLADVGYGTNTTATFSGNTSSGTLSATDGSHTAKIALEGNYLSSTWTLTSDGNGGTVVVDPVPVNAWQTLKIGGGGVLSSLDVAPDGTMVVRTDTYGAYIWNGSQWQQLVTSTSMPAAIVAAGLQMGVYEIQIASSNSSIMYMAYLGNVFKTTDRGTTWTLTNFANVFQDPNDAYRTHGQKMAIDPNNPNIVYVGTQQNGLFVTQDGGTTWQTVSAVPAALTDASGGHPGITGIMFDPALGVTGGKTNTIFAASYGNGVYESTDAGATWTHLSGSPSYVDYAAVSSNGAYYVTANNSSELWRYMNGTWTELLSSFNYWITSVAINPLNPSEIVVVGTNSSPNVSYDGGLTWTGFGANNQATATDAPWLAGTGGTGAQLGSNALVFNPLVPNQLITTGGSGVWNTILPQNWTASTPVVWNSQTAGIEQLCGNQIIVPTTGHPVLASWDRSFFYVSDPNSYATTYGPVANDFAMGWSLDYASTNSNYVVGIANWWGIEQSGYSTDGGQTWNLFPSMPAFAGQTIGGTIAASSPTDIVWAPVANQPYYTVNGGVSWSPINIPDVTDWSGFHWAHYHNAQTVTADRVLPDTFYLYYAGQGVFRSTDGGANWTKVFSGEISAHSYFNAELESVPGEAGNLFFTGGPTGDMNEPFMRSTDGGTTWTAVAHVNQVSAFGFGAPATPGAYPSIYIAGYLNGVYGIWQSNDNANSWVQIGDYPTGSLAGIRSITGDPDVYGPVYVGLAGNGFAYLPAAGTTTTAPVVNQAPVVTAINATLTHNQSVAAATLFTAADPDGQTITTYALKNVTGNGHFVVNGVIQASNVEITLTAAQLAQTTYVAGSGSDQISIRASDGTLWSSWQTAIVTAPVDQAPVVTASNQWMMRDQSIAASSLFIATDPDGDALTYALIDPTGNGYFVVNGVMQASNVELNLTAAQLAQTTYVAGSSSEQLSVRAFDGTLWSAWQKVSVTVAGAGAGAGAHAMIGSSGNDTYIVDNSGDVVVESTNEGTDTVQSSVTYTLVTNVENLALTGTSNLNGTGNGLNNTIVGNSGDNVLAGLGGADHIDGGSGTDTVTYAASSAGVLVSLAAGTASGGDAQGDTLANIENLTGSNFSDTLEGNTGNNVLAGGAGIDTLSYAQATGGVSVGLAISSAQNTGGAGTDTISSMESLTGSAFNDVLTGSSAANILTGLGGNDVLIGGGGADTLTGGAGADRFIFTVSTDSNPGASDIITDFVHGTDVIDLSAIDSNTKVKADQAFLFGGQSINIVANSVTWFESSGNTVVQADVKGNTADFTLVLAGVNLHLTASDFLL